MAKTMYDELVKQCRDCIDCLCGECKYEHLQKPGNFVPCMNTLLGEAADAIEELQRQIDAWVEPERKALIKSLPKWIPVTERCPEKSGDYLVFDNCRNLYVNEWHCLLKKWQYDDSRITHWMPLPTPPKGEQNDL